MIEISTPRNPPNLFRTVACVFIVMVGAVQGSVAQTNSPIDWAAPITVLTMAPNGAWGAATHDLVGTAIGAAIADCQQRFRGAKGCGAFQMTMRAAWILAIRCGGENILVAEETLIEAEQAAIDREIELRSHVSELPPCVRFVSVDPSGSITAPYTKGLLGMIGSLR